MKDLQMFFLSKYKGEIAQAPLPKGLTAKAVGSTGLSSQCQCDCHECAGGDTSED